MAFDRTNPTHLAELKAEVANDPNGYGYNELDTASIITNINLTRAAITVSKPKISAAMVRSTTTYEAYDGLAIDEQEWLRWMTGSNGFEEENLLVTPDFRARLTGDGGSSIWAVASRTEMQDAMLALIDIDGSRAEQLWGFGTSISEQDWFAARDL